MKTCEIEILCQEQMNAKLLVQNQEPITESRIMTFEELIELINKKNERD